MQKRLPGRAAFTANAHPVSLCLSVCLSVRPPAYSPPGTRTRPTDRPTERPPRRPSIRTDGIWSYSQRNGLSRKWLNSTKDAKAVFRRRHELAPTRRSLATSDSTNVLRFLPQRRRFHKLLPNGNRRNPSTRRGAASVGAAASATNNNSIWTVLVSSEIWKFPAIFFRSSLSSARSCSQRDLIFFSSSSVTMPAGKASPQRQTPKRLYVSRTGYYVPDVSPYGQHLGRKLANSTRRPARQSLRCPLSCGVLSRQDNAQDGDKTTQNIRSFTLTQSDRS